MPATTPQQPSDASHDDALDLLDELLQDEGESVNSGPQAGSAELPGAASGEDLEDWLDDMLN